MSNSRQADWKTSLCDPGDDGDCPRSCFIGCDQFGRTRHRLVQLDQQQDPLDLSKYKGCNASCWDYFFLCIAGLYIGSGIYTGKQTKRIRKTYNIKGNYCDDVAKGIFCQPCSLIRNDLEIRRRERVDTNIELAAGLRAPMPFGEENYRPIFVMPNTEGYRREPYMTAVNLPIHQVRGSHYHPRGEDPHAEPLYPTEEEIREHERRWKELAPLPEIPHVASPLENIERRSQLLTPISEQDSLEDPRLQQLRENVPKFPQVRNWLRSMSPSAEDQPTVERTILVAGLGNPPSIVSPQGKKCPEACPKPEKKLKKPLKQSRNPKVKTPKLSSKKKTQPDDSPKRAPETLVTPNIMEIEAPVTAGPVAGPVEVRQTPEHNLSADVLVTSPTESQRQHSLQADVFVASPPGSQHPHSLKDDAIVSSASGSQRQHSLQADPRVLTADPSPAPEHDLDADELVQVLPFTGREHSLGADRKISAGEASVRQHSLGVDRRVSVGEPYVRQHSIDSDEVISVEEEQELPRSEAESQGHDIQQDPEVTIDLVAAQSHDIDSDTRVPTPKLLQRREHSLSRDIRVMTPTSKGPRSHGIHIDERVPTPELVRLNLEHDILQDSRVLTPSPASRQHDLQEDERVESSVQSQQPRLHSIRSDAQVSEPGSQAREHGIQSDDVVASSATKRPKDHSLSADKKVSNRAYQLLESFLEQDRKSAGKGAK
ncbi:PLAC8 family-domain-containing protein [Immersiella caudata]|uniref:PLAC8 family-domain-containing protein n=1 Tax=Immersiella caudata TaxID=314043 RepID=A0AA39WQK1_9PEZI|nr:PLAC8 family-domain-containing protein [Immersiella caudata]